jgi:nitroreductase
MLPHLAKQFSTEADIICYDAPALILVCTEKTREQMLQNLNLLDCVLATQNMFLKAYELGLGTCYMGYISFLTTKPEVLKKIGVPENYNMLVPFVVGHPKTKQGAGKRKKPRIKEWIT